MLLFIGPIRWSSDILEHEFLCLLKLCIFSASGRSDLLARQRESSVYLDARFYKFWVTLASSLRMSARNVKNLLHCNRLWISPIFVFTKKLWIVCESLRQCRENKWDRHIVDCKRAVVDFITNKWLVHSLHWPIDYSAAHCSCILWDG